MGVNRIGKEEGGLDRTKREWIPKKWAEVFNAYRLYWKKLEDVATSGSKLAQEAEQFAFGMRAHCFAHPRFEMTSFGC